MSRWVAAGWFVSAYAPLFVLLAVKEYALNQHLWAYALLGAAIVGGLVSRVALLGSVTPAARIFEIEKVEPSNVELSTYLVTFVLPFIAITGATTTDVMVLVGFFALLGFLLIHSRLLLPNPVLAVLGYKWMLVSLRGGDRLQVLVPPTYPLERHTNPPVAVGTDMDREAAHIEACSLTDGLWLAKEVR